MVVYYYTFLSPSRGNQFKFT